MPDAVSPTPTSPIPCAVLMCHAPIVIPAIGGLRGDECRRTTDAMGRVARRLIEHAPDVLVIISPHTPRMPRAWGIVEAPTLDGDFARFGVPSVRVQLPGAPEAAHLLMRHADRAGLSTWDPGGRELDHGALVPLYFVHGAGWRGPTLLLSLPYPGTGTEVTMGRALRDAASASGQRWAVLASGDMSHRLTPDAPAGYHPRARDFDHRFRDHIAAGDLTGACDLDPALRELAAEDAVDSCTVAAAAVGFDARGHELLSYEGPFGVGYMEAVLHEAGGEASEHRDSRAMARPRAEQKGATPPRALLGVARDAIAAHLAAERYAPPHIGAPWDDRSQAVFVTLRRHDGELRGCIGHLQPLHRNLAEEVASCAVSAATRDTRFAPLTARELDGVRIELSLLSPPEPIRSLDDLDPSRYGVVVSRGLQRGVLLPNIDGIDTVDRQLQIAAAKAGLGPGSSFEVERFEVVKLAEEQPETDD